MSGEKNSKSGGQSMRRRRRSGGLFAEVLWGLALLIASVVVPVAFYLFAGFAGAALGLPSGAAGNFGLLGGAAGLVLLAYPWGNFLRYYDYGSRILRTRRDEET